MIKEAASGGSTANGPKNSKKKGGNNQSSSARKSEETVDSTMMQMSQTTQCEKEQGDERGSSGKFVLEWKNINFKVLAQKKSWVPDSIRSRIMSTDGDITEDQQILTNSCGYVKQGELVAIIGPSGGGKTTLLNVLARRYNMLSHKEFAMNGNILLNGKELTRQVFTKYGAFLEQDDLLCDTNTPRELISESGKMRTNLSYDEIQRRTNKYIKLLNLEDCQNNIVGGLFSFTGISAKERKRTALAVELITDPNLIFLDEPTSGLDSENAFTMIKMLKKETIQRGASVICTLHQPSSDLFQLFDRVICLSEGHVIYQGPVNDIKNYFEKNFSYKFPKYTNPSDFLLKLAQAPHLVNSFFTKEILRERCNESYSKMIEFEQGTFKQFTHEDLNSIKTIRSTSFWIQFYLLMHRVVIGFWRQPLFVGGVFGNALFCVLLISSMYYKICDVQLSWNMNDNKRTIQDWVGLAFYVSNDVFAFSVMSQVIPIPIRVPLYNKERLNGMFTAHSYYSSLWLGQNLLCICYPIIVSFGTFYFLGFKDETFENFIHFLITQLLISLVGSTFGFAWGAMFKSDVQATNSAMVYLLISCLGAGQFVNLGGTKTTVVKIISTFTPLRYAVERNFRRIMNGNDMWKPALLNLFGFTLGDEECFQALWIFLAVFFIFGWFVLIYKTSKL